jgi:mannose-6-phosphate isomerase-like protein (cupin superfamily)
MIISHNQTTHKKIGPMKISEYLINADYTGALIELDGEHGKIKSKREDRIYFIVEGRGLFEIEDIKKIVKKEDLIFIPKNTIYNIIGKMKYLLISSPAFNSKNDVIID